MRLQETFKDRSDFSKPSQKSKSPCIVSTHRTTDCFLRQITVLKIDGVGIFKKRVGEVFFSIIWTPFVDEEDV